MDGVMNGRMDARGEGVSTNRKKSQPFFKTLSRKPFFLKNPFVKNPFVKNPFISDPFMKNPFAKNPFANPSLSLSFPNTLLQRTLLQRSLSQTRDFNGCAISEKEFYSRSDTYNTSLSNASI